MQVHELADRVREDFRLFPTLRGYRRRWLGRDLTDERATAVPGIAAFALNGPLWFGNANWFRMQLIDVLPETDEDEPESGDEVDLLVLDARRIDDVDFTGFEALSDVAEVAALRDVPFLVVVQEGRAQNAFNRGGFSELQGRPRYFDTIPLAIAAYPNLAVNRQTAGERGGDDDASAQT